MTYGRKSSNCGGKNLRRRCEAVVRADNSIEACLQKKNWLAKGSNFKKGEKFLTKLLYES
jgi:hypothetical protein